MQPVFPLPTNTILLVEYSDKVLQNTRLSFFHMPTEIYLKKKHKLKCVHYNR